MTDKQSEAQRLADLLVKATADKDMFTTALGFDAANELSVLDYKAKEQTAELRRLYEANEAFGKRQEWWNERMFELEGQRNELLEALKNVTVHLIAAHSLLQRGGKQAAPSNNMFDLMLKDYEKSFEAGRAAIAKVKGDKQ